MFLAVLNVSHLFTVEPSLSKPPISGFSDYLASISVILFNVHAWCAQSKVALLDSLKTEVMTPRCRNFDCSLKRPKCDNNQLCHDHVDTPTYGITGSIEIVKQTAGSRSLVQLTERQQILGSTH